MLPGFVKPRLMVAHCHVFPIPFGARGESFHFIQPFINGLVAHLVFPFDGLNPFVTAVHDLHPSTVSAQAYWA